MDFVGNAGCQEPGHAEYISATVAPDDHDEKTTQQRQVSVARTALVQIVGGIAGRTFHSGCLYVEKAALGECARRQPTRREIGDGQETIDAGNGGQGQSWQL